LTPVLLPFLDHGAVSFRAACKLRIDGSAFYGQWDCGEEVQSVHNMAAVEERAHLVMRNAGKAPEQIGEPASLRRDRLWTSAATNNEISERPAASAERAREGTPGPSIRAGGGVSVVQISVANGEPDACVRGAKNAAFTTLSNPTALQNAAFPLLGAQHVRVQ
jgi:hypothetical protein